MKNNSIAYAPFSDLLSKIIDNRGKTCPTSNEGIPLIATNCIKNNSLYPKYESLRYVTQETYNNWFRGHPEPGDIIFVTKGTPGQLCLVPDVVDFCIAQDMVAIRADEDKIDPKYLFAVLRSSEIQDEIVNLHVGTLIPHFKKGDFDQLQIPLPSRDIQEFIGNIYLTISKKIDLLHRQSKLLESITEVIWRKMFIEDADPSWKATSIDEVAIINGKSLDRNNSFSEIEYLDTGSITEGNVDKYQYLSLDEAPSRAKRIVQKDDIVYSMVRPIQKHYGILTKVHKNTIVSTGFVVITCTSIDPHFIYIFLTQEEMTEYLNVIAEASTSAYPSLVPSDIARIDFQMPPIDLLDSFSTFTSAIWEKIDANVLQTQTLIKQRDSLLPKLMSGKVRVKL